MRDPSADVLARGLKRRAEQLAANRRPADHRPSCLHRLGLADEAFELIDQASFAYMFDPDLSSPNGAEGPSMIFNLNAPVPMMHDIRFVGSARSSGSATIG